MLQVEPFQETLNAGYCGPANLKMVLGYYGILKSENELAKLCGTHRALGTTVRQLAKAAKRFGLKVEIKSYCTYRDLKKWLAREVPVIVDWFSKGLPESPTADGHYSVVVGLDRHFIYLMDPEIGKLVRLKRDAFMRVWFDFTGDYIKSRRQMIVRQIIAIHHSSYD